MDRHKMTLKFKNRKDAGQQLANALSEYKGRGDVLLLALPRGGVPIGDEVAKKLNMPLDVLLVRKIGVPWHEELAVGAIAVGDIKFINHEMVEELNLHEEQLESIINTEQQELLRRNKLYRQDKPYPQIKGKTIIIIDDGLATGATMHAAIEAVKMAGAVRVVAAVPVGAKSTCEELRNESCEVISVLEPELFYAVGQWYDTFDQTDDKEVLAVLSEYM